MKFLIDEDLSPAIASQLRSLGVDAVSIFDLGREGLNDDEQLAFAAEQDRCFVTRNGADFIVLSRLALVRGEAHGGVLIVNWPDRRSEAAAVAQGIARFNRANPAALVPYEVRWFNRTQLLR